MWLAEIAVAVLALKSHTDFRLRRTNAQETNVAGVLISPNMHAVTVMNVQDGSELLFSGFGVSEWAVVIKLVGLVF